MHKRYFQFLFDQAGEGDGGGSGGNGAGAFDPVAFQKQIMDSVHNTLNGFSKNLKADFQKMLKPADGGGEGDGGGSGGEPPPKDTKPNSETAKLQRQLETLQKTLAEEKAARERSEGVARESTRKAEITKALSGFQFANDRAAVAAQKLFDADVRYNDAGELVAGPEELPVADFIKSAMKEHEYLLAPKNTGGSGVGGGGKAGSGGGKVYTMDDIKPGMKPEEVAAVASQIAAVLPQK